MSEVLLCYHSVVIGVVLCITLFDYFFLLISHIITPVGEGEGGEQGGDQVGDNFLLSSLEYNSYGVYFGSDEEQVAQRLEMAGGWSHIYACFVYLCFHIHA